MIELPYYISGADCFVLVRISCHRRIVIGSDLAFH